MAPPAEFKVNIITAAAASHRLFFHSRRISSAAARAKRQFTAIIRKETNVPPNSAELCTKGKNGTVILQSRAHGKAKSPMAPISSSPAAYRAPSTKQSAALPVRALRKSSMGRLCTAAIIRHITAIAPVIISAAPTSPVTGAKTVTISKSHSSVTP